MSFILVKLIEYYIHKRKIKAPVLEILELFINS